jgi:hypothetical protein
MTTPKVLNVRTATHEDLVGAEPIWRSTKWGNPFNINGNTKRADAVARFERWFAEQPDLIAAAKVELRGKNLICYCAPRQCHGDVLMRIANSE